MVDAARVKKPSDISVNRVRTFEYAALVSLFHFAPLKRCTTVNKSSVLSALVHMGSIATLPTPVAAPAINVGPPVALAPKVDVMTFCRVTGSWLECEPLTLIVLFAFSFQSTVPAASNLLSAIASAFIELLVSRRFTLSHIGRR